MGGSGGGVLLLSQVKRTLVHICYGVLKHQQPDTVHPERNTLILGFFGDECVYKPLPIEGMGDFLDPAAFSGLKEGDHFSLSGSRSGGKRIRLQGTGTLA